MNRTTRALAFACALAFAASPAAARLTEVNVASVEPFADGALSMKRVIATDSGSPIVRLIRDELQNGTRGPRRDTLRLSYEAATTDQSQARLTARRGEADPRREIPASGWAYVNSREIHLLPEGTKPEPGTIYDFHYPATNPLVLGIGMAATRDLVSFLRYEAVDSKGNANPARPGISHVLAYGRSQAGRYLRDHVAQGFNQDESARKVFDGVLKDWVKPEMDMSKPYRPLVTQINADGNEVAGILLPDIAVPLGTHTGWNLYRAPFPDGELCDRDGTYAPFAATRAEREAKNDPRASLEERYGSRATYAKRVQEAAEKAVAERVLLREDAERYLATAQGEDVGKRFARPAGSVAGLSNDR